MTDVTRILEYEGSFGLTSEEVGANVLFTRESQKIASWFDQQLMPKVENKLWLHLKHQKNFDERSKQVHRGALVAQRAKC